MNVPQRSGETSFYEPPKFSGGRDELFFKKYERAALINNWDNSQKVCFFSTYVEKSDSVFWTH